MTVPASRRGILLLNLGSPFSTAVKDVRAYLHEFLLDKRVLDVSFLYRKLLVDLIIAPFRAPKTAAAYRTIWTEEGSPLIVFTAQIRQAIQEQSASRIAIGMRYGKPSTADGLEELSRSDPEEVIILPLYPHYAMSSYETAVEQTREIHRKRKYTFPLRIIKPFYNHPAYLDALADSISPFLGGDFDQLLFSYHGLPERHIRKSDITHAHCLFAPDCCVTDSAAHLQCYRHQVMTTSALVAAKLGLPKEKYAISFQSRLGRDRWLQPDTARRLVELPGEGVKRLLVVCPAFVADCLETLEEIAQRGKLAFLDAGGTQFTYIPCLNTRPSWVRALMTIIGSSEPLQ
ncbi:MAG TPA: ferrochelatase [Chitinophagaceae bacterium]|nr:ferrochelatase [Chitinophagaceae bacterium]